MVNSMPSAVDSTSKVPPYSWGALRAQTSFADMMRHARQPSIIPLTGTPDRVAPKERKVENAAQAWVLAYQFGAKILGDDTEHSCISVILNRGDIGCVDLLIPNISSVQNGDGVHRRTKAACSVESAVYLARFCKQI